MKNTKIFLQTILTILVILLARNSFSFCLVKDGNVFWQTYNSEGCGVCVELVQNPTTGLITCKGGNQGVCANPYYEPFPTVNIWSYSNTTKTWTVLQSVGYGWGVNASGVSSSDSILSGIPTVSGNPNNITNLGNMCPGIKNKLKFPVFKRGQSEGQARVLHQEIGNIQQVQ